ncbi:MAG: L-fucose/L-arabinose isomerase family protein [Planctomycetes bacterium]|nr:L-fucose/L-arabinose isomerase family protein [Planctomycetota bacterium]
MTSQPQRARGKVGLFGIGLAAYWPQFPAMKPRLEGYQREVARRLGEFVDVVDVGLVDNAPDAAAAGDRFARERVELVVCYVGTYATSSQVLPAVQRANAPVLILNLQPASQLDYRRTDTYEWLANCSSCCVPEISCAFARSRIDFHVVTGVLGIERGQFGEAPPKHPAAAAAWAEIRDWVRAATVVRRLKDSRIGFLGHTYPGMLDMYSDFTQHTAQLGTHLEVLEMCDLDQRLPAAADPAVAAKRAEAESVFDISQDSPSDPLAKKPTEEEMAWACRVAVALDRLVADFDLNGLAYYYRGLDGNQYERLGAGLILGNSLLTARGIPASGEGDLKNCQAMKIMDLLGAGGSYTEFYAMDFDEDFLLMGHDGPFHLKIAEGKPILRGLGLYHGKRGYGVSVEAKVKQGPVTVLALTQTADGRLKLLASQGESIPGDTLAIGNTNSRIKFPCGMVEWVNRWCREGPTHHCALGVGHELTAIRRIASLLKLELVEVG